MAYVGRGINNISNASILDDITFTDSAGPYNLTQNSGADAFTPISVQALVIQVDGVIQDPTTYTISAATITFDSVMAAASTNNFIVHNGVGIVNTPTDNSVTAAKIATDAVTTAKILDSNVTYAKIQDTTTANRVIGAATAGVVSEVQVAADMIATDAVETAKIKDLNVTAGKLAATQDLSTKTITLPATVAGLGTGITNAQLAGSIDVTTKITGVVPAANLGTGTASSSTVLYGDGTFKTEPGGKNVLISTITISSNQTYADFQSMDSTYKIYTVTYNDINSENDGVALYFNYEIGGAWIDSGGNYQYCNNSVNSGGSQDQNASTSASDVKLHNETLGNATGENLNGILTCFAPSDTTNFKSCMYDTILQRTDGEMCRTAGSLYYDSGQAAVTGLRFKFSSGDIASGQLKLWGTV